MDERVRKYKQLSPERAKVWKEKSPKYHQIRKVPVVYYLCRNRQLEHPHFMEVPLSSPDGLYLRDVIERLNALRGRRIASMYSWSCKRSYKNGFVWHDLCEDDLILPAHGNEYILKGSEIFEDSSPDHFSPARSVKVQHLKQLPEAASCRSQDDSSSSSSMIGRETKHSQEDELSLVQLSGSSVASPEYGGGKNPLWNGSLSLTEYKIYKNEGLADASTQTEENVSRPKTRETYTRGISTDDGTLQNGSNESSQSIIPSVNEKSEIHVDLESTPSSSCTSSSDRKTETLETLIKADASKMSRLRILEEEDTRMSSNAKLKATNVLLQLISCGSISVKDHSFGLIPTYRPNFTHSKFPTPLFSTSMMLGDLDCLSKDPRLIGLRLEDKEYFSGSLIEAKIFKQEGDGHASLKRSSSFDADRTTKQLNSDENQEDSSGQSKCIPRSIKASLAKQPRSQSMRSPLSDKPRKSSSSNGCIKQITDHLSEKKSSKIEGSFREDKEKVTKIEERLASGARIIIQSKEQNNAAG